MSITAYYRGAEDFYSGSPCPYQDKTPDAYEWAKGWRSSDIREQCKDDYYNGEVDHETRDEDQSDD